MRVEEIANDSLFELYAKLSALRLDQREWVEALGLVLGRLCNHGIVPPPDGNNSRIRFAEAFNSYSMTWQLHYIA